MTTSGKLCDQASVRRLHIDDLTLTYIVDGAMGMVPGRFLNSVPASYWQEHKCDLDGDGRIPMSAGGLLVERGGRRMLIDTGLGQVRADNGTMKTNSGDLLKTLEAIDVAPSDIDLVALTHLHLDHTGWAFTESDSGPRPTFPNAQYVLSDAEMATTSDKGAHRYTPKIAALGHSLRQLPNLKLIVDGEEVAAGVLAMVTPGHTPGHTSYIVTSLWGWRVVVFGDMFHTPAQIANPDWTGDADSDQAQVPAARARILAELEAHTTTGFAFHFGDQPFGRIVTNNDGKPTWQPLAALALRPPPRTL
jgi:glyoxylase-like metal-dependent hydrolase (beta-lactamase superfamily II)